MDRCWNVWFRTNKMSERTTVQDCCIVRKSEVQSIVVLMISFRYASKSARFRPSDVMQRVYQKCQFQLSTKRDGRHLLTTEYSHANSNKIETDAALGRQQLP